MKSIVIGFNKNTSGFSHVPSYVSRSEYTFTIPILPALSIVYIQFPGFNASSYSLSEDFMIDGKTISIVLDNIYENGLDIIINYNGVRDYSLLFPWVGNVKLRERLGQFYEEAEKSFESGAWLSFALMCGAVFEGALYARNVSGKNYYKRICNAAENQIISERTRKIMNEVKDFRNYVHVDEDRNGVSRYELPYVTRTNAMDIRSVLDEIIVNFSMTHIEAGECKNWNTN